MVRLHHFLSIAVYFHLNLPGIKGAVSLPASADLQLNGPIAKAALEETHITNRRDGDSRLHHTLGLVKRLVEDHGDMVNIPERAIYHLLDQIDRLRDQVSGMLPSGSLDSSSSVQPSQSQAGFNGQPTQEQPAPSNTFLGGAFKETSEEEPQGSAEQSSLASTTQGSMEETENQPQGSSGEPGPTSSLEDSTEQTEAPQEPPEQLATSSSPQDPPDKTGTQSQDLPEEPGPTISPQGSTDQTDELQESSQEFGTSTFTQSSTEQNGQQSQSSPREPGPTGSPQDATGTNEQKPQAPSKGPNNSSPALGSTEQTQAQPQESSTEPGPTKSPLNPTEQPETDLQKAPGKLETSTSDQNLTEAAENGPPEMSRQTDTATSPQDSTEQTDSRPQGSSEEPRSTDVTQDSTAQTRGANSGSTGCDAKDQVSGLTPLRRDFNCATDSSAATDTVGRSPSTTTSVNVLGDLGQDDQLFDTTAGVEGSPRSLTIASLIISDSSKQNTRTPVTIVRVKSSPQTTTSASLTSFPNDAEAMEPTSESLTGFLEISQLITTVITSTNTSKSTVTLTTTRTKFLFLPLPSAGTPLGAGEGSAVNMTTTPGLSASDIAVANTPSNNKDTTKTPAAAPQTPSMRLLLRKVPVSNSTADGAPPSGFRTLSKPTRSVGEGNP
ncbi:hypothetical protein AK830_g1817 [Neonectria ditissima]|uniref:Uncharacterized protein n=1 Tax=Neonectria ditissima TaxID=78410 RepID=A0A0N8H8J7_9HYPO|nr:hypothetical protein AK830_g1817 [Neonectria ditissima]